MAEITYYLINERKLGKKENDGYFLYIKQKWVPDTKHEILDRLMGFDPYDDSPYGFGSTSIMDEIEEIPEQEAIEMVNLQIIDGLKAKWKKDLAPKKKEWDKDPGWPAKLVETQFKLNGNRYTIMPKDLGLDDDCWDQGFMESIQGDLSRDLEAAGATDICNLGFLD